MDKLKKNKRDRRIWCVVISALCICLTVYFFTYYQTRQLCMAVERNDIAKVTEIAEKYPLTINSKPSAMPGLLRVVLDYDHTVTYPLTYACEYDHTEVAKILLDAGAKMEEELLFMNCGPGCTAAGVDIVFLLIDYGADINYVWKYGSYHCSVLENSVTTTIYTPEEDRQRKNRLFDYLLEHCDLSEEVLSGTFTNCGSYGNVYAADRLLNEGYVDIDCRDDIGFTALIAAANGDESEMTKYLLERGADKTVRSNDGKTAYDYAVEGGYEELAALLK